MHKDWGADGAKSTQAIPSAHMRSNSAVQRRRGNDARAPRPRRPVTVRCNCLLYRSITSEDSAKQKCAEREWPHGKQSEVSNDYR